jgi:RHS repeat-associated protein
MLNDAAEVTEHRHYSGYTQTSVDGGDPSEMGFAAGTHAADLVILGARVYDPIAGRFLSQDPISQTINQYSYTLGNPVRFWDPTGAQQQPSSSSRIEKPNFSFGVKAGFPYFWFTYNGEKVTLEVVEVPEAKVPEIIAPNPDLKLGPGAPATDKSVPQVSPGDAKGGGLGDDFVSRGSTGEGRDGPPPRAGLGCGLGFEIAPVLITWFAIRKRRRARR